jgi:ribosomal protein L11 methylase PrmA
MTADGGSFRDPDSRVFYDGDAVYRVLTRQGRDDFDALARSGLLADPRLVRTSLAGQPPPSDLLTESPAGVLRHERVPFVSYPYEWSFSMLRDAALLQLALIQAALEHDLMLKDATPYNTQYVGTRPVHIDVGSFEPLREQELWVGYRQFCCLYLYPLLLQATKGISPQSLLRGALEGITPAQMRSLMSTRDRFRRGYLTHVFLQARLEGGHRTSTRVPARLARPGVGKAVIAANVRKMRRLVTRLDWQPPKSLWSGYGACNSYTEADAQAKDAFVRDVAAAGPWPLVWDLGANNGRHARLVAGSAQQVVAFDADEATVERLYRALRDENEQRVLPLVTNLLDPSPGLGWRLCERRSALERGRPDLVLALALVHHLTIGGNVPLRDVVQWLASLGGALIVEFPDRADPMVHRLLDPKRDGLHADYGRATFERHLHDAFEVHRTADLQSGTRSLYFATPRRRP